VYIAQVWGLDDKGHFHEPIPDSAGMLVRFSDCDLIEVFFSEGESCNEQQATLVLAGGSQARGDAAQQATNSPNPSETTERWIGSVETYPTETKPTAVGG
jgi:hypothetical protein